MTAITKTSRDGGGCGCGGACGSGGSVQCPQGAIARPRFFASQLLTQEDLQLVVDYSVSKNRLHNRLLFGEGVVCGLTVTCPPCGDGSVVVAPGYALDCCGNDIYVPCRQELDINALVRELRLRQLDGWDCGDPCKAKGCDDTEQEADSGELKPATYHYCLFIRYHETQSEPVAPYMSEAACGTIACEPSRICEGYTFELRCTTKPDPADIFDRLKACIGDLRAAVAASQRAQVNSARAAELSQGAALAFTSQIKLDEPDLQAMEAASDRLKAADLSSKESQAILDDAATRRHLADYQLLAVGVARAKTTPPVKDAVRFKEIVTKAEAVVRETTEPLRSAASTRIVEPTALAASLELFPLTARYALSQDGRGLDSDDAKMFRAGAPFSATQLSRMRTDAAQLKMFLQERLERSTALTSCDLLDRLHAIRIGDEDDGSVASYFGAARASEDLALILLEYLRDCFCLALNPVCAPCDDPAVLLACLDVRDCEVIDICNMSRRFVLSPAALRYWLPPITALGKLLERFCCELEFKRQRVDTATAGDQQVLASDRSFFRTSAALTMETATLDPKLKLAANALGIKPAEAEQAALLAGHLGVLGVSKVPAVANLGRAIRSGQELRAEARPPAIGTPPTELQPGIASTITAERDATLRVARNEASKVVEAFLSEEALDKRLNATKAVKNLTAENQILKAEIKRLSDAVKKLKG